LDYLIIYRSIKSILGKSKKLEFKLICCLIFVYLFDQQLLFFKIHNYIAYQLLHKSKQQPTYLIDAEHLIA